MRIYAATICICTVFAASSAMADVVVQFIEGAPKDRFVIENKGKCSISQSVITLDMRGSAGGLIFDVTGAGAGVEVFQPFDVVAGADILSAMPEVRDGDRQVMLNITELAPAAKVAFTIDVDDTAKAREITVTDAEIDGATARVSVDGAIYEAPFSGKAVAKVALPGCDNA